MQKVIVEGTRRNYSKECSRADYRHPRYTAPRGGKD